VSKLAVSLLRVAASINDGYGPATFLLERLGSAAGGSRIHRAGTQLGQLWGTAYLADYASPYGRCMPSALIAISPEMSKARGFGSSKAL
jgi:Tn3 transposase DDE domain